MKQIRSSIALLLLAGSACQAAGLFSGSSFFNTFPTSQLGTVTNNLVLTDNVNGFVVSGQVLINVPAAPVSGTLAFWVVDRPLDPSYGTGSLVTTTVLNGFSAPPPGSIGNTSGNVRSGFTNFPGVSQSLIPMTLLGGVDTPPWISLSATSSTFTYTSGGVNFLRQIFDLDGIYFGGPGGTWTVDVPVSTFAFSVVPEPTWLLLPSLAFAGLLIRRRCRHSTSVAATLAA